MIYTTLNEIYKFVVYKYYWAGFLKRLGKSEPDDELLPLSKIVEVNGIETALWCASTVREYEKKWQLYNKFCVNRVRHLMLHPIALKALDVAEEYLDGEVSELQLVDAFIAATIAVKGSTWISPLMLIPDSAIEAAISAAYDLASDEDWDNSGNCEWHAEVRVAWQDQVDQFLKLVTTGEM